VSVFVLVGRMVSGALVDVAAAAVETEATALVLRGAVTEAMVSAEVAIEGPVALISADVALTVVAVLEERALDGDTRAVEDTEPIFVDPGKLLVGRDVFVSFVEVLPVDRTVWLAIELDTDPDAENVMPDVSPDDVAGRVADPDTMPEDVIPEVTPEDVVAISVGVVVGVVIEPESDPEFPVPVADAVVSLTDVESAVKMVPESVVAGPVGAVTETSLVGDARMLGIMLARAVVPALVAADKPEATVGETSPPVEPAPELPGPVTPEVVGRRSEVSPPTSEAKSPPSDDAEPVETETGVEPEAVMAAPESATVGADAIVVDAVPRAVVTPETTEPRRDVTPGRRPASAELPAAVEPPLPEKETSDVTPSKLVVATGVAAVVGVTTPPGPKVMAPLLETPEADVGREVSIE
jgi:hypothetical protein